MWKCLLVFYTSYTLIGYSAHASNCGSSLSGLTVESIVTSSIARIQLNLRLGPKDFHDLMSPILSIGEAYSDFAEDLRNHDLKVYGVDLWYHRPNFLPAEKEKRRQSFVSKNNRFLISGDGRHLPFAPNSVGTVLAHNLLNNLPPNEVEQVLMETLQILKSGGQARFYGMVTVQPILDFLAKNGDQGTLDDYWRPNRSGAPYFSFQKK